MKKINFDLTKKLKNFLKIKLGIYFAIMMAILTILITVMFAIATLLSTKEIASKYEFDIEKLKTSLIIPLIESLALDVNSNNFAHTEKIISVYKQENIFNYAYVEKVGNNDNSGIVIGKKPTKQEEENSRERSRQIGDYILRFAVHINHNDNDDAVSQRFVETIINCAIIMVLFGFFASFAMSRKISEPLEKLSNAAKQISGGNFNIKIEESDFLEVNDMIESYNEMGGQLNELYNSLEQKVQERTVALEEANEKLKETQAMMVHSEKMRSLGELVAGIAHEINNPVNFIHGNIMILQNYADDLMGLIDEFSTHEDELKPDEKAKIEKIKKQIDLDFLRDDIKDLIKSCIEGTQRTKNIVLDLKNFSRMEERVLTQFDIPKEIDTTLNILNNKYKNRITVIKNYSPDAPKIEAYGGQLNQVFMNILDNAQDAIEGQGTVTINVNKMGENVKIEFIDTGSGIPEENLKKVFDPFFTTKAVGKGTGLGMSISYRVINDHNGTINVESKVGVGTKFTIVLPINHEGEEKPEENTKEKTV